MAKDTIDASVNVSVVLDQKAIERVQNQVKSFQKTLSKVSDGNNLGDYWKEQPELIEKSKRALNDFKKAQNELSKNKNNSWFDVEGMQKQMKQAQTELIKSFNALQAKSKIDGEQKFSIDTGELKEISALMQSWKNEIAEPISLASFQESFTLFHELVTEYQVDAKEIQQVMSNLGAGANVSGINEQLQESRREVIELEDEIKKLNQENLEIKNSDLNLQKIEQLSSELQQLERELESVNARARNEFEIFLDANNLQTSAFTDYGFKDMVESLREQLDRGTISAKEAIGQIKTEFAGMFDGQGNLGNEQIQTFISKLGEIETKIDEISVQMAEKLKSGFESAFANTDITSKLMDSIQKSSEGISTSITDGIMQKLASADSETAELYSSLQKVLELINSISSSESSGTIVSILDGFLNTTTKLGDVKINKKGFEDLKLALDAISQIGNLENIKYLSNVNLENFKDVKAPKAIYNLGVYLQELSKVDASKIMELSSIDLSKLNGVKIDGKNIGALKEILGEDSSFNQSKIEALQSQLKALTDGLAEIIKLSQEVSVNFANIGSVGGNKTAQEISAESKEFNEMVNSAENASRAKEDFAKANGIVRGSISESLPAIADEQRAIFDFARQVAEANGMVVEKQSITFDTTNLENGARIVRANLKMINEETRDTIDAIARFNAQTGEVTLENTRITSNPGQVRREEERETTRELEDAYARRTKAMQEYYSAKKAYEKNGGKNDSTLKTLSTELSNADASLKRLTSRYGELTHLEQQYQREVSKQSSLQMSARSDAERQIVNSGKEKTNNGIEALQKQLQSAGMLTDNVRNKLELFSRVLKNIKTPAELNKLNSIFEKFKSKYPKEVTNEISSINKRVATLSNNNLDSTYDSSFKQIEQLSAKLAQKRAIAMQGGNGWEQASKDADSYKAKINEIIDALSKVSDKQAKGWKTESLLPGANQLDQVKQKIMDIAEAEGLGALQSTKFAKGGKEIEMSFKGQDGTISKVRGSIDGLGKGFSYVINQSNALKSGISSLTGSLSGFAKAFTYAFSSYAIANKMMSEIRNGVNVVKEYDSALTNMKYTMDLSKQGFDELGQSAINMANDLNSSMNNAMEVYQIYANMNTSAEEIKQQAEGTLILSNLSGMDAKTSANDIQSVINQFDMLESQTMHIVDVYDKISANVKIDYSEGIKGIADAVQAAGQTAYEAGLSFEELSAIVAKTMEKTRDDGSSVGNALRTMMVRTSKASKLSGADEVDNETLSKASKALHDVGVEVYNADGSYRKFNTIMGELVTKYNDLTDAQKSQLAYEIAATRQTNKFSAMINSYAEAMNLANEATNANGNALENQEKYNESYVGQLQSIRTHMDEFWIKLMDSDGTHALLEFVDNLAQAFNSLADVISPLGAVITAVVTAFAGFAGIKFLQFKIMEKASGTMITNLLKELGLTEESIGVLLEKTGVIKAQTEAYKEQGSVINGLNSQEITKGAGEGLGLAGTLSTAIPVVIAAIAVVAGLTAIIDALTTTIDEANEKVEESSKAYNEAENNLNSTLTELKNIEDEINILESKPSLTFVEEAELENLRETKKELERIRELQKEELEEKKRESDKDVLNRAKKYFEGNIVGREDNLEDQYNTWKSTGTTNADYENDLAYSLAKYEQISEQYEKIQNKNSKFAKKLLSEKEDLKTRLTSLTKQYSDIYDSLENVDAKTAEEEGFDADKLDGYKKQLKFILDKSDEVRNVAESKLKWYDELMNGEFFSSKQGAEFKEKLNDAMLESGEVLDTEQLKEIFGENLTTSFDDACKESGFTMNEVLTKMYSELEPNNKEDIMSDIFSLNTEEFERNFAEAKERLESAFAELDSNGYISKEHVQQIKDGTIQTVFGNIDMDKRQVIEWSRGMMDTFHKELDSWKTVDKNGVVESLVSKGDVSTVLGGYANFDGVDIAFTPILQTEHGAELLSRKNTYDYINTLIKKVSDDGKKKWTTEDLIKLDAEGIEQNGKTIKGLIADVGKTAAETSRVMHYAGKFGSINMAQDQYDVASKELNRIKMMEKNPFSDQFKGLWESDGFKNAREDLIKLSLSGKIATEDVQKLASENQELSNFLNESGMSAQFAAKCFDTMARGGDGFKAITNDALLLDKVLHGMDESLQHVNQSKSEYDKAMSSADYNEQFKYYQDAYKNFKEMIANNEYGKHFRDTAYMLLGDKSLTMSIDEIKTSVSSLGTVFGSTAHNGFEFLDKLYAKKDVFDDLSSSLTRLSDGSYDFDFKPEEFEKIGEAVGMTADEVAACTSALGMFGDYTSYDLNELELAMNNISIAAQNDEKSITSLQGVKNIIEDLGYAGYDAAMMLKNIQDMDSIDLIDLDTANIDDALGYLQMIEDFKIDKNQMGFDELQNAMVNAGLSAEQMVGFIERIGQSGYQIADASGQIMNLNDAKNLVMSIEHNDTTKNIEDIGGKSEDSTKKVSSLGTAIDEVNGKSLSSVSNQITGVGTSAYNASRKVQGIIDKIDTLNKKSINVPTNINGGGKANGTTRGFAHVNGTAFASGTNIGASSSEVSLTGELGRELVVRGNHWFTVGDNGAEFVSIKKGDIVFNHKQTESLLNSGSITSRGKAYANGTLSGRALASGHVDIKKKGATKSTSKDDSKKEDKTKKKSKEILDWIERKLKALEKTFDRISNVAEKAFASVPSITKQINKGFQGISNYAKKLIDSIYKQQADQSKKLMDNYSKAYDKYKKTANKTVFFGSNSKKSKKTNKTQNDGLKNLIQNGAIDIDEIQEDKYYKYSKKKNSLVKVKKSKNATKGSDLKEKINKYEDWWDKSQDALDNFIEQAEKFYNIPLDKASGKVEMLADAIDLFDKQLENTFGTVSEGSAKKKNKLVNDRLNRQSQQVDARKDAVKDTKANMNSAYNDKTLQAYLKSKKIKVTNGEQIDLKNFKVGSKEYQAAVKYNQAVVANTNAVKELQFAEEDYIKAQREAKKEIFDNVLQDYENRITILNEKVSQDNRTISEIESKGATVNKDYYLSQIRTNNEIKKQYEAQLKSAEELIKTIPEGSAEWYDAKKQIEACKDGISQCTKNTYEWHDALNKLVDDKLSKVEDTFSRLNNEFETLTSMLDYMDTVTEEGKLTDYGLAKMATASVKISTLDSQRNDIRNKLNNIDKYYTFDSEEARQKKLEELRKRDLELTKEIYDEQKAIYDVEEERCKALIAYQQKLTDEKKEQISLERDLHEYQRNVSSQVKDISLTQQQIIAVGGDSSQEGLARLERLQKQLSDQEENLRETEYDRYLKDQEDLLDNLTMRYQETMETHLENFQGCVETGLINLNDNIIRTIDALAKVKDDTKYVSEFEALFNTDGSFYKNVGEGFVSVGTGLSTVNSTIQTSIGGLSTAFGAYISAQADKIVSTINAKEGDKPKQEANPAPNPTTTNPPKQEAPKLTTPLPNNPTPTSLNNKTLEAPKLDTKANPVVQELVNEVKVEKDEALKIAKDYINKKASKAKKKKSEYSYVNEKIYDFTNGKVLSDSELKELCSMFGIKDTSSGYCKKDRGLAKQLKKIGFPGFSLGGVVDVKSLESQIKANGDTTLASVRYGERILTPMQNANFEKLVSSDLFNNQRVLSSIAKMPEIFDTYSNSKIENNVGDVSITFELPNVYDSKSLVKDLQTNTQVQKIIQSTVINPMLGKSTLSTRGIKK